MPDSFKLKYDVVTPDGGRHKREADISKPERLSDLMPKLTHPYRVAHPKGVKIENIQVFEQDGRAVTPARRAELLRPEDAPAPVAPPQPVAEEGTPETQIG